MKDVYVVLAFHAHEMIWDLPEILTSYLDDGNPMKETVFEENYLKKRHAEGRDIYSLCSEFGDRLEAPLCVEYTNELLFQIKDVMPSTFEKMKKDYQRGRLYPLYGHAHHTHIALLNAEEMTQEVVWNKEYLHNVMGVPYPKYPGLFPTEDSLDYQKLAGISESNISYVIFPHLRPGKVPYTVEGEGDITYKPFLIQTDKQNLLAFPRNFPISQEIWRPITKMKRDDVKFQGYMLGTYPVFYNEYLNQEKEGFPISLEEGVEIYKKVLQTELEKAPDKAVLVYVQDLELMDFGDIALEIMEKAWQDIIQQEAKNLKIHFITPDQYIDKVLGQQNIRHLPRVKFEQVCWAPEIRLILRTDGHYPPIGVTGVGRYDVEKTGVYHKPLIFWENGKYFCRIFETLMANLNITIQVPIGAEQLDTLQYHLDKLDLRAQAVMYLRLIKRACNWGWRPTEGRQKRPCLKGFLLGQILLRLLTESPPELILNREMKEIDPRNLVGIIEVLRAFIDNRVKYLKYGLTKLTQEKPGVDLTEAYAEFPLVEVWKKKAVDNVRQMYRVLTSDLEPVEKTREIIKGMQDYCQALFIATEHIQRCWAKAEHMEFLVEKMYEYLYDLYPPMFPALVTQIDAMSQEEVQQYFARLAQEDQPPNVLAAK